MVLRRRLWRQTAGAGATALVVVVLLVLFAPQASFIEVRALDMLYRLTRTNHPDSAVELVDIGEDASAYKRFRLPGDHPPDGCKVPRRAYAEATRRLSRWGAKVILFDLFFPRHCKYEDAELAASFKQAGNVIVAATTETKPGAVSLQDPVEPLGEAVWAVGSPVAYQPNQDVRSTPLAAHDYDSGQQYLALSLLAFQRYAGVPLGEMNLEAGHMLSTGGRRVPLMGGEEINLSPVRRGEVKVTAGQSSDIGDVLRGSVTEIPDTWNAMLINWAGPAGTIRPRLLNDLLKMTDAEGRGAYQGKAVVIGKAIWDEKWTAMGAMAGPEIQANALHTLISGKFIRPMSPLPALSLLFVLALAATIPGRRLKGVRAFGVVAALMAVVVVLAAELLSRRGIWVYLFLCEMSILLSWGVTTAAESGKVASLLQRFVPSFLGKADAQRPGEIRSLDATMLFSDIRGFTTTAEQLESQDMLGMLNIFHSAVEDVIAKHGGTIVKTPGDAVLAVFWKEVRRANHATCAMRAAQEILATTPALARAWDEAGVKLAIGIGVNAGPVAMALVGKHHLEPTVIGDAVNVSQRLESLTKDVGYPLIFSETVREQLEDEVEAVGLDEVMVRGRQTAVRCYGVKGPEGLGDGPMAGDASADREGADEG